MSFPPISSALAAGVVPAAVFTTVMTGPLLRRLMPRIGLAVPRGGEA